MRGGRKELKGNNEKNDNIDCDNYRVFMRLK